jgi:hypothetical protein
MSRHIPAKHLIDNAEHQHEAGLESVITDLIKRVQLLEAARPPPRLLSQEQAAQYIGVKPPTLAGWRHVSRGPVYRKVGRTTFYRIEDIETWLDAQRVVPMD